MPKKNVLEIKNLRKTYGNLEVLKWVDLEIKEGDFFALLGSNGAGKTTTIGIMTNLVNKNSGTVKINGIDIDKNFKEARKHIGVVPQEFNFDIFSKVQDIPYFQAGYYWVPKKEAKERVEYYMKRLGLWEKRDAKAKQLSGGMKRRLMIVRALVHNPKILILDEPTAWVDVDLRNSMWDFIRELTEGGTTILLTTHYLEEVEALCNKVAILKDGEIIKNSGVKELVKTLDSEVFVFDAKDKIKQFPKELNKYNPTMRETHDFELTVKAWDSINDVFKILDKAKIEILSFRNKTNRVEQLFVNLTK